MRRSAVEYSLDELKARLPEVPAETGCYIFYERGRPIYVGKAKSLRKRLGQYLSPRAAGDPKTVAMLARATAVELILTANEAEALLLEMNLIGKFRPPYNVSIHGFPYIKVTKERFPRILVTRENQQPATGRYLGPFTDAKAIRKTVALTNRAFGLRMCKHDLERRPPRRACLDYEMGVCLGPCIGAIKATAYSSLVARAVKFITGARAGVLAELERRMAAASARLAFEEAARWRDVIRGLRRAAAGQYAVVNKRVFADAVACGVKGDRLFGIVLRVREGRLVDRVAVETTAPAGEPLEEFILSHYAAGAEVPRRVVVAGGLRGRRALAASLAEKRGGPVTVVVPRRGELAHLVAVAEKNLAYFVETAELSRARRGELAAVFGEIGAALALSAPPRRVEMVDISNAGPSAVVGGLVAFVEGVPERASYRHYRIRTVRGQDDLAAVAEVTKRRFRRVARGEDEPPDLFLVDGGPSQLAAARAAAAEVCGEVPALAAFAKDPDRLFVPDAEGPAPLSEAALLLLARIRDEAHRFAVEYHRKVRGRAATASLLDEVKGIGPRRRRALLRYFGSVEKVAAASLEELRRAPKMTATVAAALFKYFHQARGKSS